MGSDDDRLCCDRCVKVRPDDEDFIVQTGGPVSFTVDTGGDLWQTLRCCSEQGDRDGRTLSQCKLFSAASPTAGLQDCQQWLFGMYSEGLCYAAATPFNYVGCWDGAALIGMQFQWPGSTLYPTQSQEIQGQQLDYSSMSPERCAMLCDGFVYFALSQRGICSCGNQAAPQAASNNLCDFPCVGNTHLTCGSHDKMTAFKYL